MPGISGMLARFGGHRAAAGLSIDPARLAEFTLAFETVAFASLDEAALLPRCRIDAVVNAKELDEKAVEALQKLWIPSTTPSRPWRLTRSSGTRTRRDGCCWKRPLTAIDPVCHMNARARWRAPGVLL